MNVLMFQKGIKTQQKVSECDQEIPQLHTAD